MSAGFETVLAGQIADAAKVAGLVVAGTESALDASGAVTTRFTLALAADPAKTELLELTESLDLSRAELINEVQVYLAETAKRLRNPRPDCYMTLHGLPLSFSHFNWPFHASTSGADTLLVHGEIHLEDGQNSLLHAKIAASMTVTFAEIVAAPEQPFAQGFIYNAIRKTMDQGQLELVKSGNRQPVPLTTRYYSMKQKKFVFNDTTHEQQVNFLAAKLFWLSGQLGEGAPVWLLDPRDAQYLDSSVEDPGIASKELAAQGLLHWSSDAEYGVATPKLMERRETYLAQLAQALQAIKPAFNEEM